jgi:hypothetical protein
VSVPRVRDLLYRFRPSGAPGAATAAGVPVDHAARLAAELDTVFARLADTEQECAALLAEGRRRSEEIRRRDEERVRSLVAGAEVRAESERAAAATATRDAGRADTTAVREAADRGAADLATRARAGFPEYLAGVEQTVNAMLAAGARPEGREEEPP